MDTQAILRRIERERALIDELARSSRAPWQSVESCRALLLFQEDPDVEATAEALSLPTSWVEAVLRKFLLQGSGPLAEGFSRPSAIQALPEGLPAELLAPVPADWQSEMLLLLSQGAPEEVAAEAAGVELAYARTFPAIAAAAKQARARTSAKLHRALLERATGTRSSSRRTETGVFAGKPHDLTIEESTELPPDPRSAKILLDTTPQVQPKVEITITGLPITEEQALALVQGRTNRNYEPRPGRQISE